MSGEQQRLDSVRQRMVLACEMSGRDPSGVTLLAVSKKQAASLVRRFFMLGQTAFGENRAQEALAKQQELADLAIDWHFIGPVQSNKARELAEKFDWVHSVDRAKILQALSRHRPSSLPPLNICLQINIDREPQKSGLAPEALATMAEQAAEAPGIRLRGLMALPRFSHDPEVTRDSFARLRMLYEALREAGHELDTLSMGMSGDLELAIAEGSTMVRVGTDLLGPRAV